jgi:hypothetical protein
VHRSPGFITSNLIGKMADGRYTRARTRTHAHTHTERLFTRTHARTPARRRYIKEFEASHGTVADLWHAHLRGEETSFNPLGTSRARTHARTPAASRATVTRAQAWPRRCWAR